jgi:deoxycytidine triphosphate deaminase
VVLEVRSHKVPFILEDGQIIGRVIYEQLTDVPDHLYGSGIGSSTQHPIGSDLVASAFPGVASRPALAGC